MSAGVRIAARHALGWLVAANAAGLWLSLLLLRAQLLSGEWSYGRWVPVHLNGQLYGWTALPLVAWLFRIYEVPRRWAEAAVWAWTAALALGCLGWLQGGSSGKVFLDWKGGSLAGLVVAMVVLWLALLIGALASAGAHRPGRLKPALRWLGLIALAAVPFMMKMAASPDAYPPIDESTGGPLGSSLLGSTLFVIGLMLLLPASLARPVVKRGASWPVMGFFGFSWLAFGLAEAAGGTHRDWWQIGSMLLLLPWALLLPRWWKRYEWPTASRPWRVAMFGWWALLVVSGVTAYFPEVLDRLKFTHGLVAHSHLAMAGFTTSFCACLLTLMGVKVGNAASIVVWNGAALGMVAVLMAMGWGESAGYGWMIEAPWWQVAGFAVRSLGGLVMLGASVSWWMGTGLEAPAADPVTGKGVTA
ncbi:hypothetical protein [Haloferula sargassicola]|uniref:hypothetical protein n=1 Tax=Haloferula sargassicola TaxID=490096 RepID=UPI003365A7B0